MIQLKPEESLSHRVAKGGVWTFALRILKESIGLIRLIILARLLAPNDFGLFGIALLVMSTVETFSQTGFQTALIQKQGDIANYLDTAWTVSIIRGIILFILLFFSAPTVSIFFNSPEASFIIRIIGFSILLGGFTNIGIIYFQKEIEFNRQFIYGLTTTLADFIVAVTAALIYKNVWALVFGQLAKSLAGLVVSYLIQPYRPHLGFDLGKVKELSGFGKWIFGSSILIFLITQVDDIFVGKVLGMAALGFYQMAYRISNMPATEITHVISQVTFPAYSKIQDDLPRLREAYLRVLQLTTFLSFPVAGLIFVLASDFTKIFLGEKWMPMVPAMQVLVLWGLIRSIGATTGPIIQAVGKPEILTKLQFFQLILLLILIYPFTIKWGILGTSLSIVFAALIPNLIAYFTTVKITRCGIFNFGRVIMVPLINTATVILTILALKEYSNGIISISVFFMFIVVAFLIYTGMASLSKKLLNYDIWPELKSLTKVFTK